MQKRGNKKINMLSKNADLPLLTFLGVGSRIASKALLIIHRAPSQHKADSPYNALLAISRGGWGREENES